MVMKGRESWLNTEELKRAMSVFLVFLYLSIMMNRLYFSSGNAQGTNQKTECSIC